MSQELLKIFRVQELFDMSRTVLSFRRLLLSVSVREDLQIYCHYLMTSIMVHNKNKKKVEVHLIVATLKTWKLSFELSTLQFAVVFIFIFHFTFVAFDIEFILFLWEKNSIRNSWPVKVFMKSVFSACKCVIPGSSLYFKTFSNHEKLATWAVHSSWKPNYKHKGISLTSYQGSKIWPDFKEIRQPLPFFVNFRTGLNGHESWLSAIRFGS